MWLTNATVVDGTGRDPIITQSLNVEDGRIVGVGGSPPLGAEEFDCSGLTLLPGLIDAHAHVTAATDYSSALSGGQSLADLAAAIFNVCERTLEAGFTTVRDVGGADAGLANLVAEGKISGPQILPSGPAMCQTGGHGHFGSAWVPAEQLAQMDVPGLRSGALLSDGPAAMRRNVREAFRRGATQIKLCVTGGVISEHDEITDSQLSVEEIAVAVEEASARDSYVTVHAHSPRGIKNAIQAGVRCIEHGSLVDEETAALMAKNNVALVPTLTIMHLLMSNLDNAGLPAGMADRASSVAQGAKDVVAIARAAGVRVGLGSDIVGRDQDLRGLELVLRSEVEDPMQVIVSATQENARILGISDDVGTLEVGKRADIVGFSRNPLEDSGVFNDRESVALVLQNGIVKRDLREGSAVVGRL